MKMIYKSFIIILTILLVLSVGISITYSRILDKFIIQSQGEVIPKENPNYHFSVILTNKEEQYWKDIKSGIEEASLEFLSAVEINFTEDNSDYEDTLKYMDIAINSDVDGIITKGFSGDEFIKLVEKADNKGIPVITIDTDAPLSKRTVFVGTNGFEIGTKEGKLLVDATKGTASVAFIQDKRKGENQNKTQIDGFKDAVKNKEIEIRMLENSSLDILSVKKIAQRIIIDHPEVNVIVCSDANDTMGVAQVIVDYNKVGDVKIIGYDSLDEIFNYVEKGVIYGTVIPDPKMIGYESVKSAYEIMENGRTSSYVHTDVDIVTGKTLNEYKENITERKENKND